MACEVKENLLLLTSFVVLITGKGPKEMKMYKRYGDHFFVMEMDINYCDDFLYFY